jgi:hypothetical protein
VAVRKFILNIGQSNAGPTPDAATWWSLHPNLDMRSTDPVIQSPNFAKGSYSDTFSFPNGVFPSYGTVSVKGVAINSLRYLTFYDPMPTGYADYPNTLSVTAVASTNGLTTAQYWVSSMVGKTITRNRTGVVYTIATHTTPGGVMTVSANFDPPLEVGETFTYRIPSTTGGASHTTFTHTLLFGQEWAGVGTGFVSHLEGCRVKCTALGPSGHAQNLNEIRQIQSISGAYNNTITLVTGFPQHIETGDEFEILPPTGISSFDRWAYFLPWCPFEGKVNSGKRNPYPPGFNYPGHHDTMPVFNPYTGTTRLWLGTYERAAYHVGLGVRMQEHLGEQVYVVTLAPGGTSIGHRELRDNTYSFGWFDSSQHSYWSPGEGNNCFARLMDTLDAATAAAALDGDTLQCVGVFFVQGEADANDLLWSQNYRTNLQRLKTAVRDALVARSMWTGSAASIPWVQPKIKASWLYATNVNTAIEAEADADRYMRTLEVEDFLMVDAAHYSGIGATQLEVGAFQAWVQASAGIVQDASPLVLEDGVGTSAGTETTYCSADFAGVYFQNQGGVTVWNNATETQRNTALMQATIWIDSHYGLKFVGLKAASTQPLEWPRAFAYDREGYAIEGIPLALKRATAEVAKRWLEDSTQLDPDTSAGANILQDQLTVGPITISKSYAGTKDTAKRFPVVDRLFQVAGLIESGGWARR